MIVANSLSPLNLLMLKISAVACCCMLANYCFSQSAAPADSSTKSSTISAKPTERTIAGPKPDIVIYPNPAKNKVTVQVKNFDPGMAVVKVLDTKGKLVREDSRLLTNGTEDIVMFLMLKAGIYFILVAEQGKVARKKLVLF